MSLFSHHSFEMDSMICGIQDPLFRQIKIEEPDEPPQSPEVVRPPSRPPSVLYRMLTTESSIAGGVGGAQPLPAHHQTTVAYGHHMHYPSQAAMMQHTNMHMQPTFAPMSYQVPMMCGNETFLCTAPAPQPMMRLQTINYPHCFQPTMPSAMNPVSSMSAPSDRKPSLVQSTSVSSHSVQQQSMNGSSASSTSASDSCTQISHVLQCYQQGGEDPEFVRKAIESLVKKLKDKRMELDALITAVTSAGKSPTQCVTIQRSLDGRLQVAGRKGVPHVVYARIWRWPNVTKGELQKLGCCAISSDNQDFICINPYHYERIVASSYGPVDMTTLRIDPSQIPSSPFQHSQSTQQYSNHMIGSQSSPDSNGASGSMGGASQPMDQSGPGHSGGTQSQQRYEEWMQPGCHPMTSSVGGANVVPMGNGFPSVSYGQHGAMGQPVQQPPHVMVQPGVMDLSQIRIPPQYLPPFPEHWASMTYYELDTQIGETFKVHTERKEVVVDGGMDPLGERNGRFCLGALSNVHRTEASEKARLHIGGGVLLRWMDGMLFVEVRSNKPVFVRSPYLDFSHGQPVGSMVHRLTNMNTNYGNRGLKIFDLRWAYRNMHEQTENARNAVRQQAAAVAGYATPTQQVASHLPDVVAGSGVDEMQRAFCSIGIAFVKGWGQGYNRQTIKDTPCWIEIQLNRPLQILDALLKSGMNL